MHATRPLKELIAAWLDVTKDEPPPLGLPVQEALRRAEKLRRQLREAKGSAPALTELDEDSKDVLLALVQLVCDEPLLPSAAEAARLYRFIDQTRWEPDEFGQKDELLARCKEIAGAALTLQLAGRQSETPSTDRRLDATKIFEDSRTSIRMALRSIYKMNERDADEAEANLQLWFGRFCQRGGTSPNLRRALFSSCTQIAARLAPKRSAKEQPDNLIDHSSTGVFEDKREEN
jgi:hypothetical protein